MRRASLGKCLYIHIEPLYVCIYLIINVPFTKLLFSENFSLLNPHAPPPPNELEKIVSKKKKVKTNK